jgi:transcriptional regulator with XRE-family HTH domain
VKKPAPAPKAVTEPQATAPVLRSEGQRMLLHVSGSLLAIAKAIGVKSPQTVLYWRNGRSIPSPEVRAQMQVALGIPIQAWSTRPKGGPDDAVAPELDELPQTSLAECLELLQVIRRDRHQPNLLPGERTKLVDAEARILKLRADLEMRAELSEDRYVREHPGWLRVRNEISRVLIAYPEAARAVADALERLEP